MENKRRKVVNLATKLALHEAKETGENWHTLVPKMIDEACSRLEVNKKDLIELL